MCSNSEKTVRESFKEGTSIGLIMDITTALIHDSVPKFEKFSEGSEYIRENFQKIFMKRYWFKPYITVTPREPIRISSTEIRCPCDITIEVIEDSMCSKAFIELPKYFNDIIDRLKGFNVSFEVNLNITTCDRPEDHK